MNEKIIPYYPHNEDMNYKCKRADETPIEYLQRIKKRMYEEYKERQKEIDRIAAEKEQEKQKKKELERLDKEKRKEIDNKVIKELNKALGIK